MKQDVVIILMMLVSLWGPAWQWGENDDFSQGGTNWGGLCTSGELQSPIDLVDPLQTTPNDKLSVVVNQYHKYESGLDESAALVLGNRKKGSIIYQGAKLAYEIDSEYAPCTVTFTDLSGDQIVYEVSEVMVKAPSEHTIKGKQAPVELQFVSYNNETNEYLIFSQLFDHTYDVNSCVFDQLELDNIEFTPNKKKIVSNVFWVMYMCMERTNQTVYYYQGSISSSELNCSENAHWVVYEEVQQISYSAWEKFAALWANNEQFAFGNGNNRAIQERNGREIYRNLITVREWEDTLSNQIILLDPSEGKLLVAAVGWLLILVALIYT